jgi:hypothetical protein
MHSSWMQNRYLTAMFFNRGSARCVGSSQGNSHSLLNFTAITAKQDGSSVKMFALLNKSSYSLSTFVTRTYP